MTGLAVTLALIGAAIAANNLAVSLALGALVRRRDWPRVLITFGGFEFTVPLIGVLLGREASVWLADHTAWLGPLLLAGLGIASLLAMRQDQADRRRLAQRLDGWSGMIALAAGLSVDNLVVGFSIGLRDVPPLLLAGTIVTFSVTFSFAGLAMGRYVQRNYESVAEGVSGLLLLAIAAASWAGLI